MLEHLIQDALDGDRFGGAALSERVARVRAVLRRSGGEARSSELRVGKLRVDPAARSVWVGDTEVELTGLELDILAALAKQAGEVIPRDRLLAAAGRSDVVVSERAIDVHISHLRQKLGEGVRIKTVRGVGYVLAREANDPPPSERKS